MLLVGDFVLNPYHTANAAVSLQDALGVGAAGARSSVGARPDVLAAPGLVAREASFTVSAAEGALVKTTRAEKGGLVLNDIPRLLNVALPWCCSSGSWQCSLRSQVDPNTHLYPHTPEGKSTGSESSLKYFSGGGCLCIAVPACGTLRRTPPLQLTLDQCIPVGSSHSENLEQYSRR